MEDSLLCPNQCRENGIMINTRPKVYCNSEYAESMECPETGLRIPICHHGPLPFILVRRPTMEETLTCSYIDITSDADWEPYGDLSPTHLSIVKIKSANPMIQGEIIDELDYVSKLFIGRNLDDYFHRND